MVSNDLFDQTLAYDLRLFYAIVVGRALTKIRESQEDRNYVLWMRELEDLFPLVFSRVDKDRETIKENFLELIKKTKSIIHKNKEEYLGHSHQPRGVYEIEESLRELCHFIYRLLHNEDQFGSNKSLKGMK